MDIIKRINEIAVAFFDGNNSRFAERMGTSEANIRNYRSRITPKVDFLVKLCNELEISFDWLFNGTGPQRRAAPQRDAVATEPKFAYIKPGGKMSDGPKDNDLLIEYIEENELLWSRLKSLERVANAQEETIQTQKKLIERLEKLIDPKSGSTTATDASRPVRSSPRQLDPKE